MLRDFDEPPNLRRLRLQKRLPGNAVYQSSQQDGQSRDWSGGKLASGDAQGIGPAFWLDSLSQPIWCFEKITYETPRFYSYFAFVNFEDPYGSGGVALRRTAQGWEPIDRKYSGRGPIA